MAKRQEASTDTSAFYMELSKLEKNQEFDKALKICNKILNVTPKDDMAFQCKMVNSLIFVLFILYPDQIYEISKYYDILTKSMLRKITLIRKIYNRFKFIAKATNLDSVCFFP